MTERNRKAEAELKGVVERILRFEEEIAELKRDLKLEYKSAEGAGYDAKALKQIVKEKRGGKNYCEAQLEFELVVDTYRQALDLPIATTAEQSAVRALQRLTADGTTVEIRKGVKVPTRDGKMAAAGEGRETAAT